MTSVLKCGASLSHEPGSAADFRWLLQCALVAQRIEYLTSDQRVGGSSPSEGTNNSNLHETITDDYASGRGAKRGTYYNAYYNPARPCTTSPSARDAVVVFEGLLTPGGGAMGDAKGATRRSSAWEPSERPVDVVHGVFLEGRHDVCVEVSGDADLAVAEDLLDYSKLHALRE